MGERLKRLKFEYESQARVLGMPLICISVGIGARTAKGFFALGNVSKGVIAIGIIAMGGFSLGLISLGVLTVGCLAAGLAAFSGIAVGAVAVGGMALGIFSLGGIAWARLPWAEWLSADRWRSAVLRRLRWLWVSLPKPMPQSPL